MRKGSQGEGPRLLAFCDRHLGDRLGQLLAIDLDAIGHHVLNSAKPPPAEN